MSNIEHLWPEEKPFADARATKRARERTDARKINSEVVALLKRAGASLAVVLHHIEDANSDAVHETIARHSLAWPRLAEWLPQPRVTFARAGAPAATTACVKALDELLVDLDALVQLVFAVVNGSPIGPFGTMSGGTAEFVDDALGVSEETSFWRHTFALEIVPALNAASDSAKATLSNAAIVRTKENHHA